MPSRALFYPDWCIQDPKFLFESIIYWDRLACIVPDSHFRPSQAVWCADERMGRVIAEANDRFVTPVHPTLEQKTRAHEKIEAFAIHVAPKRFQPGNFGSGDRAVVSSLKLLPETVELLRENQWMREGARDDINEISSAAGNLVMAAVAAECASKEMPPVTDDPAGFVASCDLVLNKLGIDRYLIVGTDDARADGKTDENVSFLLEPIPHLALEVGQIDHRMLKRLMDARDKPDVAGLQKKYREEIDRFLMDLADAEIPERQLIRDSFRQALKRDLDALKKDLFLAGLETLGTKEGVAAIALGAVLGTAAVPGVGTIGGLIAGLFAYRKTRREKLEKHWASWLFGVQHPRFSIV